MTRWRRRDRVAQVESADRVALLDLDRPERPPLVLEGSAAVIWGLLDGSRDETGLCADVAARFAVEVDEVAGPTRDFLSRLHELGLVEPA